MRTGFYPGSFDPATLGHVDIIARAVRLVDRLVIGIGVHDGKKPVFTAQERIEMLLQEVEPIKAAEGIPIDVVTFDGLVVDAARAEGAGILIRGVRNTTDFAYEMPMAGMNAQMMADVQTVFLPASPGLSHIASSLVRQIASMHGDISGFVSENVARRMREKFTNND
ncbi:MAG: pantetheine-phosphate adenylyltransferase [Fimbriimonadaceae bacterium]|nr:pantetheine-phosphate adenylyltransferase [Alphaproteobacteria bacterium]